MIIALFLAAFPNPNTGNASGSAPARTVNPVTYGADPTCTRDSSAAINLAITSMSSVTDNSVGYILSFPPGCYKLSSPIDVVRRIIMTCNVAISNKTPACYMMPDAGVTAIVVHSANDGSADGGTGQFSVIQNMAIFGTRSSSWSAAHTTTLSSFIQPDEYSHYVLQATSVTGDAKTGGSEPVWSTIDYTGTGSPVGTTIVDNHVTWTYNFSPGIYCKASCHLSYVSVDSISGDSIAIVADTNNTPPTNDNGTTAEHVFVQDANGSGLYIRGGDTNAGNFSNMDFEGTILGWCLYDYSFLGNKHVSHQCAATGGLGAYYLRSASAAGGSLDDSYSEGGVLPSKIVDPAQLIGGFAATTVTTDSTGLIISGKNVKTDLVFSDAVDGTSLQLGGVTPAGGQGVLAYASPSYTTYTHFGYSTVGWWTLNVANAGDEIYRPYSWTDVNTTWGTAQFWTPNGTYVGWVDNSTPGSKLTSDTAAPVSGIYKQGDIVFNRSPTAGSAIGWRCTASSGTPASCSSWETLVGGSSGTATGITAHAGGGQGSCTALTAVSVSRVDTVASNNDSVCLPICTTGFTTRLIDKGANTVAVFPLSGGKIQNSGTDLGTNIADHISPISGNAFNGTTNYLCVDGTLWITL